MGQKDIIEYIKSKNRPVTLTELHENMNMNKQSISIALRKCKKYGEVKVTKSKNKVNKYIKLTNKA